MNKEMDKKLDQMLADMPKPEYDLDAWLAEDESEEFDRLLSHSDSGPLGDVRRRFHSGAEKEHFQALQSGDRGQRFQALQPRPWWAVAACLLIIIGIAITIKPVSNEPIIAENNAQPLPSLVGEGVGSVTPHKEPQGEVQTTHQKKIQPPSPAPRIEGRGTATRPESLKKGRGATARTIAKKNLPDTLGTSIWQRRENVVRAMQLLSDCAADIRQEEQEIRNGIVEATFRATPQPKNAILVTTEAGDLEVIETRNIIEI